MFPKTPFLVAFGLSKHLETKYGGLKPVLGLVYQHEYLIHRVNFYPDYSDYGLLQDFDFYRGFAGEAGLEYKISWFSLQGTARFPLPYDSSDTISFKLGANFSF